MHSIYCDYADHVVFQSEYCRLQCLEIFGECNMRPYKIIHNGVDPTIFFPGKQLFSIDGPVEFITTGNFRRPVMLKPILDALDSLKNKFPFRLHICGPIKDELIPLFDGKQYVITYGGQTPKVVANLLRKSHVFLFSNINPPCPNSVLEAVASGLPVVSFNSGSLSELLHFSRDLLADVSPDIIQLSEDMHYELLAEKILSVVEHYSRFQTIARKYASEVTFSKCGDAYREIFLSAIMT